MSAPPLFRPRAVRAVVFDLDGTLIDSYVPIAASLNHAREQFSLPPLDVQQVRRRVGRGLESLIAELVGSDRVDEGVRLFRERYAEVFAEGSFALPDVPETLRALHDAGYRMGIASNKPARFSEPLLAQLGLLALFHCVMGPDVVDSHKPDPTMIHRCLERLQVAREEAVYVGDMVLDVESAARAGLPVLLLAGGSSTVEELKRTGCVLLRRFSELSTLLPAEPAEPA